MIIYNDDVIYNDDSNDDDSNDDNSNGSHIEFDWYQYINTSITILIPPLLPIIRCCYHHLFGLKSTRVPFTTNCRRQDKGYPW